jgi:uncharacterized protein with FMN-binding domain
MNPRRSLTALAAALTIAVPTANEVAFARDATSAKTKPKKKKVVVTRRTVAGPQSQAGRWGYIEVALTVRKQVTIIGKRKRVARRITAVKVPVYPDHTDRSVFINQQALPILVQETLLAQFNPAIDLVSGATETSNAFEDSLQSAILLAKKV